MANGRLSISYITNVMNLHISLNLFPENTKILNKIKKGDLTENFNYRWCRIYWFSSCGCFFKKKG
jgi:hypothetical protein